MNIACPFQARLSSFLAGQLTTRDEEIIENHVDTCIHCQQLLDELTQDSTHATVLSDTDLVEEPLTPRLRRNVAAAFASEVGTYTTVDEENPTKPERPRTSPEWPTVPGYEISGLLGRGGIGEVYRATDLRLKRIVALKIIRQAASPEERERLQREAFALASFRHPGVVQIYEIGETGNRPFLALEYVGGGSLSRYLAGKPQPPRAAAKLVSILAETIHLAHRSGLVHRDLKPANVLLSWESDSRIHDDLNYCRPKITDFGLVKNLSVESGLTHSRDLLGTPSYMAPEQAGGDPDAVGPACDIWALGTILYELLTGRPQFQGANALDTLLQVRQSDPVPLTRLQPKLPRDLETICLKCLEKTPAQRYATAQELAEDLHRFRDGQTILARPVSPAGRAWRWCRRNRAVSSLAGLAAVLLCVLAVGGPLAAIREVKLRAQATERAEQAEAQRVRADKNLDLATLALEDTLKQVYERIGVRPDTLHDFDQNAWAATIPYLEQLITQDATTPDLRLRRARAMRQLARSLSDRGETVRAASVFEQSIAELAALVELDRSRAEIQRELGVCHLEYGKCLLAKPPTHADGVAQLRMSIDRLEQLVHAQPDIASFREDLANATGLLGEGFLKSKDRTRLKDATPLLTRAAELRRQLSSEFPNKRGFQASELFALFSLGIAQTDTGDIESGEKTFNRALEIAKQTAKARPGDPQILYLQAMSQDGLSVIYWKSKRLDEANASALASIGIHDRLANAFPAAKQFAYSAMQSHELYRKWLVQQEDWGNAARQSKASLAIIKRYCDANPEDRSAKVEEMAGTLNHGDMLRRLGQRGQAIAEYRKAISIGDELSGGATPTDDTIRRVLAEASTNLGELLMNDPASALASFERAVEALAGAEAAPTQRDLRKTLRRALLGQAKALKSLGRVSEAEEAESRAGSLLDD